MEVYWTENEEGYFCMGFKDSTDCEGNSGIAVYSTASPPVSNENLGVVRQSGNYDQKKQLGEDRLTAEMIRKRSGAWISVQEAAMKEMNRSDILAAKELQRTKIVFYQDGTLALVKEQFGRDIKGKLPITIMEVKCFAMLGNEEEPPILYVQILKEGGKIARIFLKCDKLKKSYIKAAFDKAGIDFGFGEKKEMEVKKKVILQLTERAEIVVIPQKNGWYNENGKWKFAFPETLTWKKVMEWK